MLNNHSPVAAPRCTRCTSTRNGACAKGARKPSPKRKDAGRQRKNPKEVSRRRRIPNPSSPCEVRLSRTLKRTFECSRLLTWMHFSLPRPRPNGSWLHMMPGLAVTWTLSGHLGWLMATRASGPLHPGSISAPRFPCRLTRRHPLGRRSAGSNSLPKHSWNPRTPSILPVCRSPFSAILPLRTRVDGCQQSWTRHPLLLLRRAHVLRCPPTLMRPAHLGGPKDHQTHVYQALLRHVRHCCRPGLPIRRIRPIRAADHHG